MTERLYLQDPYLTAFRARIVEVADLQGKPAAVLDKSAFYPEGGGQPGDRGQLGAARVLDTQEREGKVLHILDRPLQPSEVDAQVDWQRRFDHMQQHHGQHLLSAAFETVGAQTISFHLGERTCTIDLDVPPDSAKAKAAEARANESIWRDLPVVARDFSGEERAGLPLRKEAVKGDRVVLVEGVDASPCGGTHPRRTGEVGCVSILKIARWGDGKSRIEFVCGGRVVSLLAEANAQLAAAAEALKCAPSDLATAAARVAAEAQSRRKQADALLVELAQHETIRLKAPLVVSRIERGAGFARSVAQALAQSGSTALLGAVDEGRGHLIFARPKGAQGVGMGALLKEALAILNGKGGGNPDFAQGSGEPDKLDEALALARSKLV
ncbi:MAG TPA: DHHA1 domain-containing protein [Myxococcales bacterium]|jgi:alanyl-tRNA synthetase